MRLHPRRLMLQLPLLGVPVWKLSHSWEIPFRGAPIMLLRAVWRQEHGASRLWLRPLLASGCKQLFIESTPPPPPRCASPSSIRATPAAGWRRPICVRLPHIRTMRYGSTAKVLLKCKLKYYRISECIRGHTFSQAALAPVFPHLYTVASPHSAYSQSAYICWIQCKCKTANDHGLLCAVAEGDLRRHLQHSIQRMGNLSQAWPAM